MSGRVSDIRAGELPLLGAPDEEGRVHFLIHLPVEEQHEDRWCLWRPDHASFDERSIFEAALVVRIGPHSEERFKMRLERIREGARYPSRYKPRLSKANAYRTGNLAL